MAVRLFALVLVVGVLSCTAPDSVDPDAMGGIGQQVTATPDTPSTTTSTEVEGAWVFVSGILDGRPIEQGSSDDVITLDVFPLGVGGFDECRGVAVRGQAPQKHIVVYARLMRQTQEGSR